MSRIPPFPIAVKLRLADVAAIARATALCRPGGLTYLDLRFSVALAWPSFAG
jgi:hypothetical protein